MLGLTSNADPGSQMLSSRRPWFRHVTALLALVSSLNLVATSPALADDSATTDQLSVNGLVPVWHDATASNGYLAGSASAERLADDPVTPDGRRAVADRPTSTATSRSLSYAFEPAPLPVVAGLSIITVSAALGAHDIDQAVPATLSLDIEGVYPSRQLIVEPDARLFVFLAPTDAIGATLRIRTVDVAEDFTALAGTAQAVQVDAIRLHQVSASTGIPDPADLPNRLLDIVGQRTCDDAGNPGIVVGGNCQSPPPVAACTTDDGRAGVEIGNEDCFAPSPDLPEACEDNGQLGLRVDGGCITTPELQICRSKAGDPGIRIDDGHCQTLPVSSIPNVAPCHQGAGIAIDDQCYLVEDATQFTSLVSGQGSTGVCTLDTSKAAWCWGYVNDESFDAPTRMDKVNQHYQYDVATIQQGRFCGISGTGSRNMHCWAPSLDGMNFFSTDPDGPFSMEAVAGGVGHGCALGDHGNAWCWGTSDSYGSLGGATPEPKWLPQSDSPVTVATGFTALAVGSGRSCGADGNGDVWCWGAWTRRDASFAYYTTGSPTPARISTGRGFTKLSGGTYTMCGLDGGGNAWCWGRNYSGTLGTGSTAFVPDDRVPYQVALPVGVELTDIDASADHHVCALDTAGSAWCWGSNSHGQLGRAGGTSATPTRIEMPAGVTFTEIVTTWRASCALDTSGYAWCWGDEIRDGSVLPKADPLRPPHKPTRVDHPQRLALA